MRLGKRGLYHVKKEIRVLLKETWKNKKETGMVEQIMEMLLSCCWWGRIILIQKCFCDVVAPVVGYKEDKMASPSLCPKIRPDISCICIMFPYTCCVLNWQVYLKSILAYNACFVAICIHGDRHNGGCMDIWRNGNWKWSGCQKE